MLPLFAAQPGGDTANGNSEQNRDESVDQAMLACQVEQRGLQSGAGKGQALAGFPDHVVPCGSPA